MNTIKFAQVRVDDLIPYARNAKTHPAEQVVQIAASIREFGFLAPVVIDGDNGIVAGHGRVLAAQKLGMETVPCVQVSHLTKIQRRAYILADNRLAQSPWDDEMLKLELEELAELNFDIELTGFSLDDLEAKKEDTPEDFRSVDEDIDTEHECPKCGYRWSGGN